MVARHQHIGHYPIAIAFDGAAQRLQFRRGPSIGRSEIAERGQAGDLGRRVGDSGGRRFGGAEQRLLACVQDGITGEIIDTGELRQGRGHRRGKSGFRRRGLVIRPETANGRRHSDADGKQCNDGQRAIGHGFLRAQQRDQNDDPEESRRGKRQPHRKSRRTPERIQR